MTISFASPRLLAYRKRPSGDRWSAAPPTLPLKPGAAIGTVWTGVSLPSWWPNTSTAAFSSLVTYA
ncbi:hypothetical protein BGV69_06080 [Burkholderia ubonensis]|nr:hypothetical protein BGV69_06080 [Burkholderia ubonensis]